MLNRNLGNQLGEVGVINLKKIDFRISGGGGGEIPFELIHLNRSNSYFFGGVGGGGGMGWRPN